MFVLRMFLKFYFRLKSFALSSVLLFVVVLSSSVPERRVLAVTDWPPPLSLPRLRVSGPLVSVWVSSCRLFVDCARETTWGRRGGGCQKESRQLLWARALSLLLHLLTTLHLYQLLTSSPPGQSPSWWNLPHTPLHLSFPLCPVTLFPCLQLFLSLSSPVFLSLLLHFCLPFCLACFTQSLFCLICVSQSVRTAVSSVPQTVIHTDMHQSHPVTLDGNTRQFMLQPEHMQRNIGENIYRAVTKIWFLESTVRQ